MRNLTRVKVALGSAGALTLALGLVAPAIAKADYAPSGSDVVGVGSDTLQYMLDFLADGDALGDTGYNSAGNRNRVVNFDATTDANARLAYGVAGGSSTVTCTAGTGTVVGTFGTATPGTGPCVLNPTIVLRAGLSPVQRPNGSGAGLAALLNDTTAPFKINYVRSSSPATALQISTAASEFGGLGLDSITIGNDPLAMISIATGSNAVALSESQLGKIYSCTGDTANGGGAWRWSDVGGTSNDLIIPIVPQVGSGTRKTFLADIGVTTPGPCVVTSEENDPFAPASAATPKDAIAPMSGGRLNLFLGDLGATGGSNGVGGYFFDPSCPLGTTSPASCTSPIIPSVKYWTTGSPSDGQSIYDHVRPLFVYFRDSDVSGVTSPFQPGGTNNWIRVLFYNPCSGTGHTTGCTTVGGFTYGPGGAPFVNTSAGQGLISAAGVNPTYAINLGS